MDRMQNPLTPHPVSPQKFEREMTMIFLELEGEFSPERVETRMAEYNAILPPQPEIKPVECVLKQTELDKVPLSLFPADRLEKPMGPIPSVAADTFPKVAVTDSIQALSPTPLAPPSNCTVGIPAPTPKQNQPMLKPVEKYQVALPQTGPWKQQEDSAEDILKSEKGDPLKLAPLPTVTVPGTLAVKPVAPLALPTKCSVEIAAASPPPEDKKPLSLQYPGKFPFPVPVEPVEQKGLSTPDFESSGKIAIQPLQLKPQKEVESLNLEALSGVAIPNGVAMPPVTPPVLPGQPKISISSVRLPEEEKPLKEPEPFQPGALSRAAIPDGTAILLSVTPPVLPEQPKISTSPVHLPEPEKRLDISYPGQIPLPGEVTQHSPEPLEWNMPNHKVAVSALKPLKESEPFQPDALSRVAIPGETAIPPVTSPVLPEQQKVFLSPLHLPKQEKPLDVSYPGQIPLPGEMTQHSLEPLNWNMPDKVAIPAPKPLKEPEPFHPGTLSHVAIPGEMIQHAVPSQMPTGMEWERLSEKLETVPLVNIFPEKGLLETESPIGPRLLQDFHSKRQVKVPENTGAWFSLDALDLLTEKMAAFTEAEKAEKTIPLQPVPDIMGIWEEMGGPAALIADFRTVL